jgi:two-component system, chemotaxis family, protein-glutamate methylesterase/glutaminase
MEGDAMSEEYRLDRPGALTCPECGGALTREENGSLLQFRCHIGHVLTAETMLAAHFDALETKLAACLVALNERAELLREMSETARAQAEESAPLEAARIQALERAKVIKRLLECEWTQTGRADRERMSLTAAPQV